MATLYRSVIQRYSPTPAVKSMFPLFLLMVNECVRLGLDAKATEYEDVKRVCYSRMLEFQVDHGYRVSAIFEASNLLKKNRTDSQKVKVRPPFCHRPYVAVSVGVRLEGDRLSLPGLDTIELTSHSLSVLRQNGVSLTSVTVTPTTCSVVYHKVVEALIPSGMMAVDVNLDNVTTFDTSGSLHSYDLSALTVIHETYRRVKSRFRRNDVRIKRRVFRKYAAIEWQRKEAILHNVSSQVVEQAVSRRQALVLEDLRGIREMYTRRSGSTSAYLSEMNAWPFRQLLRELAYKAEWAGLPVHTVSPEWTSEKCSECGGSMATPPVASRDVVCLACGLVVDRDENGAKNILRRGLRSWPVGSANEAMVGGQPLQRGPTPESMRTTRRVAHNDSAGGSERNRCRRSAAGMNEHAE